MATTLPPTPYKSKVVDQGGMVTPAWGAFFRELFSRVGGSTGSSTTELLAEITSLQSQISAINTELKDIGQGRAL